MTHAYDASHLKNSGSGVEDSGAPDPPKPPVEHISPRVTVEIDDDGMILLVDVDGDFVCFDNADAWQKLLAYVEKWK